MLNDPLQRATHWGAGQSDCLRRHSRQRTRRGSSPSSEISSFQRVRNLSSRSVALRERGLFERCVRAKVREIVGGGYMPTTLGEQLLSNSIQADRWPCLYVNTYVVLVCKGEDPMTTPRLGVWICTNPTETLNTSATWSPLSSTLGGRTG